MFDWTAKIADNLCSQNTYDNRMIQLEDEIKRVDTRLESFLDPAKASYRHAEGVCTRHLFG